MCELAEAAVKNALSNQWVAQTYHYIERVGSTNDLLKNRLEDADLPAGTVFLTDFQSQGRGRLQRRWEAPPGTSLLFSVLFRPDWPAERLSWLTMIAGTAVAESIEAETGLSISLKWPNDVVIKHNDTWYKICGILLEGHVTPDSRLAYAILGIGINVNVPAQKLPKTTLPATSLSEVLGRPVSRLNLLLALLQRLEYLYDLADLGVSPHPAWEKRLNTIGQNVMVYSSLNERPITGIVEGTWEWGELLVRDNTGQLHKIMAGDVTLRQNSAWD